MTEEVKGRGASGYVVGKDKQVLESRLDRNESKNSFICNDYVDIADIGGVQR